MQIIIIIIIEIMSLVINNTKTFLHVFHNKQFVSFFGFQLSHGRINSKFSSTWNLPYSLV